MANGEVYVADESEENGSSTAQGAILSVLGTMLMIPGVFLVVYGTHLLRTEGSSHHANMAVVLGPILLLAGLVVLFVGLIRCGAVRCQRGSSDTRFLIDAPEGEGNVEAAEVNAVENMYKMPSGASSSVQLQPATDFTGPERY